MKKRKPYDWCDTMIVNKVLRVIDSCKSRTQTFIAIEWISSLNFSHDFMEWFIEYLGCKSYLEQHKNDDQHSGKYGLPQ